ncbi:hypothetical protein N0V90_004460 [Kalmusia sp. IMI 367209]|nr:hypothetical protein N0V90_004460 [Kalmusia sp. IMI 367209]
MSGLCAGVAESVLVLTPGENLKTKLIDDAAGAKSYRSSTHAIRTMLATEGPLAFFRGIWPVTLKQSSNAMVRFTSYGYLSTTLKPIFEAYGAGASTSVAAGSLAGVITVYCTMPFDNVKTQLQSVQGKDMYASSWDCAKKLVRGGGLKILWKGTMPRLIRLSANEACVDVDGRNKTLSIPRDFAANARARIQWLENQLRRSAPGVNINEGPTVDFGFLDASQSQGNVPSPGTQLTASSSARITTTAVPPKRPHALLDDSTEEQPFATEARSVALDLGLLTLNSDSRQKHYLGTSSGRLFTSLIGLGSPETASQTRSVRTPSLQSQTSPSRKPGPFAHTKRLKESCRLVYESLRKQLPSREDAQILLDIYVRTIHVDHPFLQIGSFIDALNALYHCAAADTTAEVGHNGWVETVEPFSYNGEHERSRNVNCTPISIFTATFHIYMVFTLAAIVRTRQRMYDFAPDQFYRVAMSIAAIQGRPLGIRDETFDVDLPTLVDLTVNSSDVKQTELTPEVPIPAILAFSLHRFKLDPIISEIKLLLYHLPSQINAYTWPEDYESAQATIRKRLEDWRRELSNLATSSFHDDSGAHERFESGNYELKLQSQFFAAMILLYQPSQMIPQPSNEALLTCYQCAAARLNTYNSLYDTDSFVQSWRSVQGIFSSGATMIYCLWTSSLVQSSISLSKAMSDLRTCTNLLSVGGEWWPSVKRGTESFGRAIDSLFQTLDRSRNHNAGLYEGMRPNITRARGDQAAQLNQSPIAESDAMSRVSFVTHPSSSSQHVGQYAHDIAPADWNILEPGSEQAFRYDSNFDPAFFEDNLGNTDLTIEAFIAEFLQNDTAWNPF